MEIFVLCGAGAVSGGPELAHQLCYAINTNTQYRARMCYVDLNARADACLPADVEAPANYEGYHTEHVCSLEEIDREENVAVIPEGLTLSLINFTRVFPIIWWMSVDNYFVATDGQDLNRIKTMCQMHLVQSFYAKQFAETQFKGSTVLELSDYINLKHGTFMLQGMYRQNIALYNPKKGYDVIKPLIDKADWIQWIPLRGLSLEQTIFIMQTAKLYVDFGAHPGKDRIPREAAVNGCCVITNKAGSAGFFEDVPIPEVYKFEDPLRQLDDIEFLMHDICDHFDGHQADFEAYRKWIHGEKDRFDSEVKEFVAVLEKK